MREGGGGGVSGGIWEAPFKNRSAKRTCVGLDLLLFHSVRALVLNISIRELKYYQ